MDKCLITRQNAAEALSISVDTLDSLNKKNLIQSVNIGARVYYTPDELHDFVQRLVKKGGIIGA